MGNRVVGIWLLFMLLIVGCSNDEERLPTFTPAASPEQAATNPPPPTRQAMVATTQPLATVNPGAATPAEVKFVQASSVASVDIYANNQIVLARFRAGSYSTEALDLPSGEVALRVVPAGSPPDDVLLEESLTLEPRARLVLALTGADDSLTLQQFTENLAPLPASAARVNVLNLTGNEPVDVQVGEEMAASNLAGGEMGASVVLPAGEYPLSINGTAVDPLNLRAQAVVTLVIAGSADPIPLISQAIPQTLVRFVHASPDMPEIRLLLDDQVMVERLTFQEATEALIPLESRRYQLRVESLEDQALLLDTTLVLNPNTQVEVLLYDQMTQPRIGVFPVDTSPLAPNTARLSVIHALPEMPILYANIPYGLDTAGGQPSISYGTALSPVQIEARPQVLSVQGGTLTATNSIFTTQEITFEPGMAYTYIIASQQADEAILLSSPAAVDETLAAAPVDTSPQVRIVNATDSRISVTWGGVELVEALPAGTASEALSTADINSGEVEIEAGENVIEQVIMVPGTGSATLFVLPEEAVLAADVTDDIPVGQARVRFVNGVTGLDSITLYWYFSDGINQNDPFRLLNPLRYGNSAYTEVLPGSFNLMIIDPSGEVVAEERFAVEGSRAYDVVVLADGGDYQLILLPFLRE